MRSAGTTTGRDKFLPVVSPLMPDPIPSWTAALQATDRSPSRLVSPNRTNPDDGKYLFPEPALLAMASGARQARYFATWDVIREACKHRLTAVPNARPLSGQQWRSLLALSPALDTADLTAILGDVFDRFKIQIATLATLPPTPLPDVPTSRIILWELAESNFRWELLALDRRACRPNRLDNTRHLKVFRCFTGIVTGIGGVPEFGGSLAFEQAHSKWGFAALEWKDRLPFLLALRELICDWQVERSIVLDEPNRRVFSLYTKTYADRLEAAVTQMYCQTFFSYFGRAAVIPYRLS